MTDRELMQQALETAEQIASADYRHWGELASLGEFERWARSRANHIAEALRARLSQPEPAECDGGQCGIGGYCKQCPKTKSDVPETAFGEIKPVLYQVRGRPNWDTEPKWGEWKFCTEPVANDYKKTPALHDWEYQVRSLYTAPPQRPWVGLTDDEFDALEYRFARYELCRAIEAKLKEKNT